MSTDQFLDGLAGDLAPVRPRTGRRDLLLLAGVGALELGLFLGCGAARPDIGTAAALPCFWWKVGGLAALTATSAITAIRSFDPAVLPRKGLKAVAWLTGLMLVAGWGIDALGPHGASLPARLMWPHGLRCIASMVVLSIPVLVTLGFLMRRGAPTDRSGSGLAVGAASATWGAFVFAFNCPHDDPLNVAVWYAAGCAAIAVAGRLILPRVTRW